MRDSVVTSDYRSKIELSSTAALCSTIWCRSRTATGACCRQLNCSASIAYAYSRSYLASALRTMHSAAAMPLLTSVLAARC
jgi:hypothetical protein